VHRPKARGFQAVQPATPVRPALDESDLTEHPQVFETWGWDIERSSTIAFSPAISASRICRRCASAIALKTSDVVEERAMVPTFRYRHVSSLTSSPLSVYLLALIAGTVSYLHMHRACESEGNVSESPRIRASSQLNRT
jgi:hypothetical protein